jgi:hypothetical protein
LIWIKSNWKWRDGRSAAIAAAWRSRDGFGRRIASSTNPVRCVTSCRSKDSVENGQYG